MQLSMYFVAVLLGSGLVAGAPPSSSSLKSDIDELIALIPLNKIVPVVVDYLASDVQVKELVDYARTDDFKQIVSKMAALPEYKNTLDYLESVGLNAYRYVNAIHTVIGLPGFKVTNPPALSGGVAGLLTDVSVQLPLGELNDVYNTKPQLQEVMARFQGKEFQSIVEKLTNLPEFKELLKRFNVDQWKPQLA